jgi:hypothetical protein
VRRMIGRYAFQVLIKLVTAQSTVKAFQERAQCVARQYSSYSIPGPDGKPVYINGNLTNGEDLGDSGIKFAYNAWKKAAVDEHVVSQRLPGLNFTEYVSGHSAMNWPGRM